MVLFSVVDRHNTFFRRPYFCTWCYTKIIVKNKMKVIFIFCLFTYRSFQNGVPVFKVVIKSLCITYISFINTIFMSLLWALLRVCIDTFGFNDINWACNIAGKLTYINHMNVENALKANTWVLNCSVISALKSSNGLVGNWKQ